MSTIAPSIDKTQQTTSGARGKNGKLIAMKAHQATRHHSMHRVISDVMRPAPNANSLNNGAQIKYFLEKDTLRNLQSITLRFQVLMDTANGVMVPTAYWFDRIEIYVRRTGDEISRTYNDIIQFFLTAVEQEQTDAWAPLVNYDEVTYKTRAAAVQVAGDTRYYYLPLPANVLEGFGLDVSTIDSDIEIRLHPKSEGPLDGTLSAAGADPQLIEIAGIYQEEKPDVISDNAKRVFMQNHISAHNYLDTQQYVITSRTMNASNTYEFDLDQFDHCSAALVLALRPTGASNTTGDYQVLGDLADGSIDVLGVSGDSMYGGGRAVRADYLKDIVVAQHWGSSFIRTNNVYPIPFGHLERALHGIVDGCLHFDGSKMRLAVTTPAGWVNGNYDVYVYSLYFRTVSQNGSDIKVEDIK